MNCHAIMAQWRYRHRNCLCYCLLGLAVIYSRQPPLMTVIGDNSYYSHQHPCNMKWKWVASKRYSSQNLKTKKNILKKLVFIVKIIIKKNTFVIAVLMTYRLKLACNWYCMVNIIIFFSIAYPKANESNSMHYMYAYNALYVCIHIQSCDESRIFSFFGSMTENKIGIDKGSVNSA